MDKRKKNIQYKARRETFQVHQYWNLNYTEKYTDGSEKDFKTFIKAKSYDIAKEILLKRLREDDPSVKIKAVHGFLFHKGYKPMQKRHLTLKEWEQIRKASFPNQHNVLFKLEIERDPSKSNRFNWTNYEHLKTIGFKSGEENWSVKNLKGKILPLEERANMIYRGKWVVWDKESRKQTLNQIVDALIKCNHVRQKAAKYLKISRHKLYKLMERFPEMDWNKQYPPPKPFENARRPDSKVLSEAAKKCMKKRMQNGETPFKLTPEQEKKRREGKARHIARQRKAKEERLNSKIPLIKEALEACDNQRNKAAEYLGWKVSYLSKTMSMTKHIVHWSKEYPNPNICKKHL